MTTRCQTRRRALRALSMCALAGAAIAAGATLPSGFVHHGHFKLMMHTGDTAGRVALSALTQQPGHWGVGATAGLRGEIVQIDGRLLVSRGTDPQGRVGPPAAGEQAALFAGARVVAWREVAVPHEMDAAAFDAFVRAQAQAGGLAADEPFVFRVEGRFPHLLWHVVTGDAPAAPGGGASAGHGSGHGGQGQGRAGQRLYRQPGARGQLVGVYSGAELEGVVSHPGERLHLHYIDLAQTVSGHVDRFSVAAGAVLRLPIR